MRKLITGIIALLSIGVAGTAVADSFVNVYTCEMNDGVEVEDVHAANSKWLKWVNDNVEGGGITSAIGTAVVGNQEIFIFVDTYPSLITWATAQEALADADLDELFEDTNECSENRLWRIRETE